MADTWDDVLTGSSGSNRATPSNSDWDSVLRPSTLGGKIPQRSPYGSDASYYEPRYQAMGAMRRARAGAQNIVSSIPLVRSFAPEISPPEAVEIARGARPFLSGVERTTGHAAGYAALPNSWLSTLPRAAASGAALEGLSAATEGEPIAPAAVGGAVSAIPGSFLSKTITPRTPQGIVDVNTRANLDILNALANKPTPVSKPTPSLGITDMPRWAENLLLSGGAAYLMHPSLLLAGIAPSVYNRIRNAAQTAEHRGALRSITRNPARNFSDRANDFAYTYGTNQIFNPQMSAMLQALSMPAIQETMGPPTMPTLTAQ